MGHLEGLRSDTACAFSNAVDKTHYDEREDRYLKAIAKYRKEEQALFPELLAEMTVALEKKSGPGLSW